MGDNITWGGGALAICLWDSICNHCHPVKRSEDVIMEGAALPTLFNHAHRTAHSNQERQAEGCCLCGVQGDGPHLMSFSALSLSLLTSKESQAETGCTDCLVTSLSWLANDWSLHATRWPGMPHVPSLSTSTPVTSPESWRSIIALALLQHSKGSLPATLSPPSPGKQKG